MFEPFPDNYVWNLSVGIALAAGGLIGEIDPVCRRLADLDHRDDAATTAFFAAWCELADRLVDLADEDEAAGHRHSAGAKHRRAAIYYQTAERMQARDFAPRAVAYAKTLASFARFLDLTDQPAQRVEIPFGDSSFPGILMRPQVPSPDPTPCVIFFNGLDSTKEQFYCSGIPQRLAELGIATLMVDPPGSGEALRLRGLTAIPESERWAAACIDHLEALADIDSSTIGLVAWSLGGYYGPRATAFEPRIAFSVAWGANYDWGRVQQQRLLDRGARPVPHYWEHVCWVWGAADLEQFLRLAPRVTLRGIMDRVRVPFLVVHGEHDRQISVDYAHQLYDDLVNSPARTLKIFTDREGGVEHCSVDNMPVVVDYICDWIGDTVAALQGSRSAEPMTAHRV